MGKNYRWGILGAGRIADKFCTALNFVDGAEVYAIASRDSEKAQAYKDKFNASVVYNDYEALMKDDEVDIVYIATPHAFHYGQAMQCIQHGKHVLCEKPLTLRLEHTEKLLEAATGQGVFFMEAMWTACMPFIEKITALIKDDVIGKPQYIAADFGFDTPVDVESRLYNKDLGGGSLMDVGIYPVFLATHIFGEPSEVKTVARLSVTGIDEYMNMVLQYPGGETAHLLSSVRFNTAIEAEIIGTKGTIKIHNPWFKATDFSLHLKDAGPQHFSVPHQSNGFEHEIREVMYCLDNGMKQSAKMPHQLTVSLSRIMETALQQAGIKY